MRNLLLAPVLGALAIIFVLPFLNLNVYGAPGTIDFLEYWSAFQLVWDGLNPYDEQLMRQLQLSLGQKPDHVIMMWNPPWTLVLFWPFFMFDFFLAAEVWLCANILLIFLVVLITRATFAHRQASLLHSGAAGVFFVALYDCINVGQVGIFLAFWLSVFLWAQKNKKDVLAGVSLVYLSVKPHLFLIFFVFTLLWILQHKRFKILLSSAVTLIIVCLIGYGMRHAFLQDWLEVFQRTTHIPQVVPINDWISANLVGWARGFFSVAGQPAAWPRYVIPAIGVGVMLFLVGHYSLREPFEKTALPIIIVSVLFSPFGWFFDQSVLVVVQIVLVQRAIQSNRNLKVAVILLLFFTQLTQVLLALSGRSSQDTFFWAPAALLLIWFIQERYGERPT